MSPVFFVAVTSVELLSQARRLDEPFVKGLLDVAVFGLSDFSLVNLRFLK